MQYYFVKEKLETEEIYLNYCSTEDMMADALTKVLANDKYQALTWAIGL